MSLQIRCEERGNRGERPMKLICPDCGQVDYAIVNGEVLAESLFEDVWFEVRITKDKIEAKVRDDAKDYFETFNKKHFLKEARKAAYKGEAQCPHCFEFVKVNFQ